MIHSTSVSRAKQLRQASVLVALTCACVVPSWAGIARIGVAPIRIELRPHIELNHATATLSDIAEVSGGNPATLQALRSLPLGQIASGGEPVVLGRAELARWIRSRLGLTSPQITWEGSQYSEIQLGLKPIPGTRIAKFAQDQMLALLRGSHFRANVLVSHTPLDVAVPAGQFELRMRPMSGQPVTGIGDGASGSGLTATLLVKRRSVWVDIWVDERFVRTVPVPVEISVVAPAYVALRDLPAGEAIDARPVVADQFAVQDVEWSGRNTLPVSVAAEFGVGEFRLTHSLSPGQALTRADIAHVPLVLRGDMVTLRAHEGGISLESRVEALQDGDAGKAVRVKLSDASTSIVAYVIGPGLVELRR